MHIFTRTCPGIVGATCNCAVAVLVADDVVVIDRCGPIRGLEWPLTVDMFVNGELSPEFSVLRYPDLRTYDVSL